MESFQYIYNFIRRFTGRSNLEVTTLLFTISETGDTRAMETLEKTAGSFLRRSDVLTRYSSRQLLAGLPDATDAGAVTCAERIIEHFKELYTGDPVQIDYAISRMEGGSMLEASDNRG